MTNSCRASSAGVDQHPFVSESERKRGRWHVLVVSLLVSGKSHSYRLLLWDGLQSCAAVCFWQNFFILNFALFCRLRIGELMQKSWNCFILSYSFTRAHTRVFREVTVYPWQDIDCISGENLVTRSCNLSLSLRLTGVCPLIFKFTNSSFIFVMCPLTCSISSWFDFLGFCLFYFPLCVSPNKIIWVSFPLFSCWFNQSLFLGLFPRCALTALV